MTKPVIYPCPGKGQRWSYLPLPDLRSDRKFAISTHDTATLLLPERYRWVLCSTTSHFRNHSVVLAKMPNPANQLQEHSDSKRSCLLPISHFCTQPYTLPEP